jgi:hypothetical protein
MLLHRWKSMMIGQTQKVNIKGKQIMGRGTQV